MEELKERGVEGIGKRLKDSVFVREGECLETPAEHARDGPVRNHDAFRLSRGAAGVNDIREVSRIKPCVRQRLF